MPRQGKTHIEAHIGIRLRLQRKLLGLTQHELGEKVGLTFQQIQKYEKGSNRVTASRLYQLAQALSVNVAYFYEGLDGGNDDMGSGFHEGGMDNFISSKDGLRLNRHFLAIEDPAARRAVIGLVRALAERDA